MTDMLKIKMRCDNCARWGETCEGMINPEEHCDLWKHDNNNNYN